MNLVQRAIKMWMPVVVATMMIFALTGCRPVDSADPPLLFLDDSTCAYCGMIISDPRFATATIIEGDRGTISLLFDDFNCQHDYATDHPDRLAMMHWCHDYETSVWIDMSTAYFVRSAQLQSPMASNIAAFQSEAKAQEAARVLSGKLIQIDHEDAAMTP